MELKDKLRMNQLYDIYSELLTEKQKEYFDYYYLNDYSLSEISEILSVSRNAVHMQLKNVVTHLENYEEKLGILRMRQKIMSLIERLDKADISTEDVKKELEKV